MKNNILILISAFIALSCSNNGTIIGPELASFEKKVVAIDNLKSQRAEINAQLENFKIGSTIKI
jgi:hypothetical protein